MRQEPADLCELTLPASLIRSRLNRGGVSRENSSGRLDANAARSNRPVRLIFPDRLFDLPLWPNPEGPGVEVFLNDCATVEKPVRTLIIALKT